MEVHLPALVELEHGAVVQLGLEVLRVRGHEISAEVDVLEHALQLGRERAPALGLQAEKRRKGGEEKKAERPNTQEKETKVGDELVDKRQELRANDSTGLRHTQQQQQQQQQQQKCLSSMCPRLRRGK